MLSLVDDLQTEIAAGVADGVPVEELDDELIKPAPLNTDLRAALWLYAWALEKHAARTPS
jgi:hypothetical protein